MSRARERIILDACADGIAQLDDAGRIRWANPALCRMYGYADAELEGAPIDAMYADPAVLHRLLVPRGVARIEAHGRRKDDSVFPAESTVGSVVVEGRRVFVVAVRDVTEPLLLQRQELDRNEERLARIGHELHDSFGQLLTGIAFIMKGLERELEPAQAQRASYVVELINDAIRATRDLAGGLSPATLDHRPLRGALAELVQSCARLFDTPCTFEYAEVAEPRSSSVRRHLYLIAREAITNAVRHAQPTHIEVSLFSHAGTLVLSVRDNGVGIEVPANGGAGMGLGSMRHRAKMIGGELEIVRLPDGGTSVRCRWIAPP